MLIDLIQVPYDSGHRGARMGGGPGHLVASGAVERLREAGATVRETAVGLEPGFTAEIAATFDLARATAFAVRTARGRGSLPIVLAGNCISAVGTLAALPHPGTGVVWLDAHADLNTPETTTSGMVDGMALSAVLGRCWTGMTARIDGFAPIPEEHVLLAGVRDVDPPERYFLERSRVLVAGPETLRGRGTLAERLDALAARVEGVYLHIDLDVHDPGEGRANDFAAPGGLTAEEVRALVHEVAGRIPIQAAAITAFDPAADGDGRMLAIALDLLRTIAETGIERQADGDSSTW
ncbi:MAG TPA: arginase family protein [Longimicrobium sp.]|nr:arginase family protein [Longimicrobium sp.]